MPDIRIGISGWTYAPWRGVFFPPGLVQKRELEFASKTFNSIEINGTFYSTQRPTSLATRLGVTDALPKTYADLDAVTEEVRKSAPATHRKPSAEAASMSASHKRATPNCKGKR